MSKKFLNRRLSKLTAAFLSAAMILTSVAIPVLADEDLYAEQIELYEAESAASSSKVFVINNADDLKNLGGQEIVGTIELAADIDMSGVDMQPIKSLTGSFFGNGYIISNLTIETAGNSESGVALIGALKGTVDAPGKVSDVIFKNPCITLTSITPTSGYLTNAAGAAAAVGVIDGSYAEIKNCAVTADATENNECYIKANASSGYPAALVGYISSGNVIIDGCLSSVNTEGSSYAGGLVGCVYNSNAKYEVNIYNSAVLKDVSGKTYSGGIIGFINGSDGIFNFKNCYFAGKVSGTNAYGYAYSGRYAAPTINVENCYYNNELNKPAYSWSSFDCFGSKANVTGKVNGITTDDFKTLVIDGFTIADDYPYPIWYVNKDGGHTLTVNVSPTEAVPALYDDSGSPVELTQDVENSDKYTCNVTKGKYSLTVTPPEGDTEHGAKTTDVYFGRADKTINVVLTAKTYNVSFNVTPASADFKLYKDDKEMTASEEGTNNYVLTAGDYSYTASDFGYVTKNGTITVTDDCNETVNLEETERYNFKFNIYPSSAKASVKLNRADGDKREMSPQSGFAYSLPAAEYDYEITADGYKTKTGSITIPDSDEITLTLVSGDSWDGTIAKELSGKGTEEEPYEISNGAELAFVSNELANSINSGYASAYYILTADIDLGYQVWTPIGKTSVYAFKGHFDGQGNKIIGLNVSNTNNSVYAYYGLFGYLTNAEVKNLTVCGEIYCDEGSASVGSIAATATGNTTISNCASAVSVSAKAGSTVGGIVGLCMKDNDIGYQWIDNAVKVTGCMNKGNILMYGEDKNQFSQGTAGGVVGYSKNCVQIENSCNLGSVTGANAAAGICGEVGSPRGDNSHPYVKNCYNAGEVTGKIGAYPIYKGSLGQNYVTNCYSVTAGTEENKYVEIKTADELKSDDILTALNSGSESPIWQTDEDINSGYPYQIGVTVPEGDKKLSAEAEKYVDVLAVSSAAEVGDIFSLVKDGQTPDADVNIKILTDSEYVARAVGGKIKLIKKNETSTAITETATILLTGDEGQIRREVKVIIAPDASARQKLMNTLAGIYASKTLPDEWVVFDMAAYNRVNTDENAPKISEDAKQNYINLAIDSLNKSYTLATDRAKAEVILSAIAVDSTKLYPVNSNTPINNAELLRKESFGDDYTTAIWTLLADLQGNVKLDKAQTKTLVNALLKNQNENGVFSYRYGLNTYTDVDSTGWALAALARFTADNNDTYGVAADAKKFIDKALDGLSNELGENGSYGNINSDSMVITGLTALGINPSSDSRFVKNGCSLGDAPMLYVNSAGNGFVSAYVSGDQGEKLSAQATEQGFRGLVALEAFEKCGNKAYNIYVPTIITKADPSEPSDPSEPKPAPVPDTVKKAPAKATGTGSVETPAEPSESAKNIKVSIEINGLNGNWISVSDTEIKSGSAVYHLLKSVAEKNDIIVDGLNKGYVKSMTYKNETLAEFSKGQNSGWLYYVNGELPQVGINDYILKDGDKVEFKYTADYTVEPGMGSMSGGGKKNNAGTGAAAGGSADADKSNQGNQSESRGFNDVKPDDWFSAAVSFVCGKNIMRGTSESEFEPNSILNRAMFVTILYRMESEPSASGVRFTDIADGEWYTKAVAWATENGIVNGVSDTEFAPDENITREQMAAIIYRYIKFKGGDLSAFENTDISAFDDYDDISDYAIDALCYANGAGLISGRSESTLNPNGTATRAEAATVIMRMFDKNILAANAAE